MRNSMNRTVNIFRTSILASALIAVFAMPAVAQTVTSVPILTASGDGSANGLPDIAIVTLGVVAEGANAKEALASNATDMTAVIKAITDAGIETRDVATSGLSVEPIYSDPSRDANGQSQITGYRVINQVTVKIRNLASSGPLLDKVVTAGANRVTGISFEIDKADALRDAALKAAITDAHRKAELMAEAAGVKLGEIQSITAFQNSGPPPVFRAQMAMKAADSTPVMGGEQQLTANATVVYAISPR